MLKYGLKIEVIQKIQQVFKQFTAIEQVIIYGSRAKGNFRNGSDIDLVLRGKNLDLNLVSNLEQKLDDLMLPYTFDISIFNNIENTQLIKHINDIGKIFYLNT